MARPLRIEYAGAVYHVMARGNQGQPIFRDDRDRRVWLATLAEAQVKTGWRIHACVLMGNHYHLLLETPEGNLVAGMKWLQGTCARWQKDAPEKVALAWWLRERTTVSLRWVATRLGRGHYTRVTQAVSRLRRQPGRRLGQLKKSLATLPAEEGK